MELSTIIGYALALLIGLSLGLIGSGGSILTVPILVYILHIEPVLATAYSLFIVGSTSLVGGIRNVREKNVNFKIVWVFGLPSLIAVYCTRAFLLPLIPEVIYLSEQVSIPKNLAIMVLFAVVMFAAAIKMIRPSKNSDTAGGSRKMTPLVFQGIAIGLLAGTVGAGGGFLIIPALVLFSKLPMKNAMGTSLFIIAIQSLIGFLGDLKYQKMDWNLLLIFSLLSIMGIFIGIWLSKKVPDRHLKTSFGWFVLLMASYILLKELFF